MMNCFKSAIFFLILLASCKQDKPQESLSPEVEVETVTSPQVNQATKPLDERMSWQKPNQVIQSLGNIDEKVIADLGAGIGYFSFKLLPKSKKVIAIDIDSEKTQILEAFKSTLSDELSEKFDVRLATPSNPCLLYTSPSPRDRG